MELGKHIKDENSFSYLYDSRHFKGKQLSVLYCFARDLLNQNTKEEIAWAITKQAISQLGFEDCVIYLINRETNMLEQIAAHGPKNPTGTIIKDPIEIPIGKGIVGLVAQTGMPELVPDTTQDERYIVDDTSRASEIAVPIILNGEVIGVIDSESSIDNFYTHEHVELLLAIATMAAMRFNHAKSQEKLDSYKDELELVVNQRTEELKQAISELKRSNGELENYAHAVSHDLMEPIRNISSFLGLIRKKEKNISGDGQVFIKHAFESAKRLEKMLAGLLAYSKIKSSNREISKIDLNELMADIVTDLSYTIEKNEAKIVCKDLPIITGHRSLIRQLFQNLIINAIKFAKPGVPPIVRIEHTRNEDNSIFKIVDNGIGIEEHAQKEVFNLFSRLEQSEHLPGTGLGLSLSQRIVALHNGSISVFSDGKNQGTTFTVVLPAEL